VTKSFVAPLSTKKISRGSSLRKRDDRRQSSMKYCFTIAVLRSLVAVVCIVVTFVSSMLLSDAAHAERTLSATLRASGLSIDPFAPFATEVSKRFTVPEHWIRAVMHVESGGKQTRLQVPDVNLRNLSRAESNVSLALHDTNHIGGRRRRVGLATAIATPRYEGGAENAPLSSLRDIGRFRPT
jgi:hypothetical protein